LAEIEGMRRASKTSGGSSEDDLDDADVAMAMGGKESGRRGSLVGSVRGWIGRRGSRV
jgi:hypothetical protein